MRFFLYGALAVTAWGFSSMPIPCTRGEHDPGCIAGYTNPCKDPNDFTPDAGECNAVGSGSKACSTVDGSCGGSYACGDVSPRSEWKTVGEMMQFWGAYCCCGSAKHLCFVCADDDAGLAKDSQGQVADCATGLISHTAQVQANGGGDFSCSADMFANINSDGEFEQGAGAPMGWFLSRCPVTCGMC